MNNIIDLIKNKNYQEILNYSKSLSDDARFSTIAMLKELNIDKDIFPKKEDIDTNIQKSIIYYKEKRQIEACLNYFLVICTRSYDDLDKINIEYKFPIIIDGEPNNSEVEYISSSYNPFYYFIATNNYEPLINFYKLFPPNYFNKIVQDLSKKRFRNINFKLLWKLYENGWVEFDEEFFVRSLFNLQGFDNNHFDDANFLIANSNIMNQVFLKFYKYEIPILNIKGVKIMDYSNVLSDNIYQYWFEVFKILIKNDVIKERKIIANLLETLLNNWKQHHLTSYIKLLDLFQPTKDELIENQPALFAILGTGQPSLIKYAMLNIESIYTEKKFDTQSFLDNFPIIFSNEKVVKPIFVGLEIIEQLLATSVKINIEYREQLCLLFMQPDSKLQERVANIMVKSFYDKELAMVISPFVSYLKQGAKDILQIDNVLVAEQNTTHFTQKIFQPIAPLSNWDELLLHIGTCIRTKAARDIEICFEGIIQLQSEIPADYRKQLKPYTKQLFNKHWENSTMLYFAFLIECWVKNNLADFSNQQPRPIPFLAKKAEILLVKLYQKDGLPFLSTPTHEPFYVHPDILLDKLLKYEEGNAVVHLEDLIVACNRILLTELQGNYKDKLSRLNGYYVDALRYLFGLSEQITFTDETLPLWTQMTRIKNPYGIFPEFEKSKAANYPTVVHSFDIGYKVVKDGAGSVNWYRLMLDKNWNYSWYNKEEAIKQDSIFYNAASSDRANKVDIAYQLSLNPNYVDAILCRYIPNTATGNEVDGFEDCLYPLQFILENQLSIYSNGWLYVAVCLLFEKKVSRDLAAEYIHLAIYRKENLENLSNILANLINDRYAPVSRFIEYLDKSNNSKEIKFFQFQVLSNCIKKFDKQNLPINSKKLIAYYKELQSFLKLDKDKEIEEKLLKLTK
jgi:hypothetical protein